MRGNDRIYVGRFIIFIYFLLLRNFNVIYKCVCAEGGGGGGGMRADT